MLIICTQDETIIKADLKTPKWGTVTAFPPGTQPDLQTTLSSLKNGEPLCFSAHGNDTEIGDASSSQWSWSYQQVALMIEGLLYDGIVPSVILFSACGKDIANFSARVVVEVEKLLETNEMEAPTIWVYGYNDPIPANRPIPAPGDLSGLLKTDFGLQVTCIGKHPR